MVWTVKESNLLTAIRKGSISEINQAIQNGAKVNAKDNDGWTPLMFVCGNNASKEVIELLIDKGAKVNAKDDDGWTPLMFALYYAAPKEVIELLIAKGAKVNAKANDCRTALTIAAIYEASKEVFELLIAKGADVNAKDNDGWTPLMHAAYNKASKEVIELLKKAEEAQFAASKANLAKSEQENAKLKQQIDEQNARQAWNNLQAKKREKKRMRALRLGQYRHR